LTAAVPSDKLLTVPARPSNRILLAATVALLALPSAATTPDRSVLRLLNRYESENTIRDFLAAPWLQLKDSLPEDGLVQRFNKSEQALDVSHVQMTRYMEAGEQAMRRVVAASDQPQIEKRYYAREQKRFLGRMRYSSFKHAPRAGQGLPEGAGERAWAWPLVDCVLNFSE